MSSDSRPNAEEFLAAARAHERSHRLPAAVACYLGAGQWQEAARLLSHLGHFYEAGLALLLYLPARPQEIRKLPASQRRRALDAALCFARGGARREAVGLLMNLGQSQKAANLLVRAGLRSDAVRAMRGDPIPGNPWPPGVVFPLYSVDELISLVQQTVLHSGPKDRSGGHPQVTTGENELPSDSESTDDATASSSSRSASTASRSVSTSMASRSASTSTASRSASTSTASRSASTATPRQPDPDRSLESRSGAFLPPSRSGQRSGSYDQPSDGHRLPPFRPQSHNRPADAPQTPRQGSPVPAARDPWRRQTPPRGDGGELNYDFDDGEIPPLPAAPRPPARGPSDTRRVVMPGSRSGIDPTLTGDLVGPDDTDDEDLEMAERAALVGPGTIVGDRYEIRSLIGAGGMASVYRAYDTELEEDVALKMFRVVVEDPVRLRRFRREMKLHRRLVHPNIVQTFEFGTWNGARYITMELLDGQEFHDFIQENKDLEIGRKLNLMMQVCDGLGEAHKQNIVHRDIKPANLFVVDGGRRIKVMDFGIAKAVDSSTISITGVRVGTPRYMSPEQIQGNNEDIGVASDLYSLGAVMFELFTGRAVFTDDDLMPLLLNHLSEQPDPPSQINPAVPRVVEDIILRLLEKNPRERYPDAATVKSALLRAYVQTQQL